MPGSEAYGPADRRVGHCRVGAKPVGASTATDDQAGLYGRQWRRAIADQHRPWPYPKDVECGAALANAMDGRPIAAVTEF